MSDFRFHKNALPGRMLSLAGVAIVLGLCLIAMLAWSSAQGRQALAADMRATIARADGLAGSAVAGPDATSFYVGDTPQLAQAAMQTNLQTLAETFGIQIEVIRADAIEQVDRFVRLNLTLNGVAPEASMGAFLHGLAALEPMVIVEEMSLRRARTSRSDPERRVAFQAQLYGLAER